MYNPWPRGLHSEKHCPFGYSDIKLLNYWQHIQSIDSTAGALLFNVAGHTVAALDISLCVATSFAWVAVLIDRSGNGRHFEILHCSLEHCRVISEASKAMIACCTKQSPHLAGCMIVICMKLLALVFALADGAYAVLFGIDFFPLVQCDTVYEAIL